MNGPSRPAAPRLKSRLLCAIGATCRRSRNWRGWTSPGTPLPRRAYRHPEDAREQLRRAREYHERLFGSSPAGLWPSEGSVSDQALILAAEEGFQWFGTDEGVLGRTLNAGFFRDANGIPANAERLYKPWQIGRAHV